jgi:aryl-alcohol dehydrogenase-like predicted oxidoreductase
MSAETLRAAHAVHPIAAMQTEYSLMTRNPEIAVLDACRELGTTFVAFSPVARGALAGGYRGEADLGANDIRRNMPRFTGEGWEANRALIAKFEAIAAREGVTPAQLSLAWVLAQGEHIVAIPGTANAAHLEENIARWDWEMPEALATELDALINRQTVFGERYNAAMQRSIDTEVFA